MESISEYLDAAKSRVGIKADWKLSTELGLSPAWTHRVRAGKDWPSDEAMIRLAELAGADPARALLQLNLWRARDARVTEQYSKLLQRLVGLFALLALVMANSNTVIASTIIEQNATNSVTTIYYQKWRIYLLLLRSCVRRLRPIYLLSA